MRSLALKISVQRAPKQRFNANEVLAKLCYYYPQYTLRHARKLPYKDVVLLIKQAQKEQATDYYNLTQIAAAPHSDKGKGVKKLLSHFKEKMK